MQSRQHQGLICVRIEKLPSCENLIQKREVNTTSEAKYTKVLGNGEVLITNITKNFSDITKEDYGQNLKKKLKDVLNTDKEMYE